MSSSMTESFSTTTSASPYTYERELCNTDYFQVNPKTDYTYVHSCSYSPNASFDEDVVVPNLSRTYLGSTGSASFNSSSYRDHPSAYLLDDTVDYQLSNAYVSNSASFLDSTSHHHRNNATFDDSSFIVHEASTTAATRGSNESYLASYWRHMSVRRVLQRFLPLFLYSLIYYRETTLTTAQLNAGMTTGSENINTTKRSKWLYALNSKRSLMSAFNRVDSSQVVSSYVDSSQVVSEDEGTARALMKTLDTTACTTAKNASVLKNKKCQLLFLVLLPIIISLLLFFFMGLNIDETANNETSVPVDITSSGIHADISADKSGGRYTGIAADIAASIAAYMHASLAAAKHDTIVTDAGIHTGMAADIRDGIITGKRVGISANDPSIPLPPATILVKECCDQSSVDAAILASDLLAPSIDEHLTTDVDDLKSEVTRLRSLLSDLRDGHVRSQQTSDLLLEEIKKSRHSCDTKMERMSRDIVEIGSSTEISHPSSGVDLSNYASKSEIATIIKGALEIFAADRLGIVDYALESIGGSLLTSRCTEAYSLKTSMVSFVGYSLWYRASSPRTIIQPQTNPGDCWAFKGTEGRVAVKLSIPILVMSVSIDHISPALTLNANIDSAPKDFVVLGLQSEFDNDPIVLGRFTYDIKLSSIQTFDIQESRWNVYPIVELQILSNNGNERYTCLYRFRVHGSPPIRNPHLS